MKHSTNLTYIFRAYGANCLINPGVCKILVDLAEQDKINNKRYKKLSKCDVEAQTSLMSQRAFIPEGHLSALLEIHKDGIGQINAYERRFNKFLIYSDSEKRKFSDEEYNGSRKMSNKLDNVNAKIRERLDSLIIIYIMDEDKINVGYTYKSFDLIHMQ